jgi:hypothetical protein
MVRWHLAMVMGNMAYRIERAGMCSRGLLALLDDASPFVRSWAISGLCQIARRHPSRSGSILDAIAPLTRDASIAVRHRASKAISILMDPRQPLPSSWVKRKG